jgi:hypothetical protein
MTDQDPTQGFDPPPTGASWASPPPPVPPVTPTPEPPAPAPEPATLADASWASPQPPLPAAPAPQPPAAPAPQPPAWSTPPPQTFAQDATTAVTQPVATYPVVPEARPARPGRSKLKWLVAVVAVVLVAGTALGAGVLLTSKASDPAVLAWAPADSIMYGEARLDLPGSQGAELAKIMKAFPGFDDQAAFPAKMSEMLDQLVDKASSGKVSWKTDIDPWFGGQVAFSMSKFPSASDPESLRGAMLVNVKDATKATAWIAKLIDESGSKTSTESYGGTTITLAASSSGSSIKAGYAIVGPVLVVGDLATIKAVIDTKGTTGLPSNAKFKEANAAANGDRLGFFYADYRTLFDEMLTMMPASGATLPRTLLDQMPTWVTETFRVSDSAFVVDVKSPHADLNGTSSESKVPGLVPASTIALIDGHDVGAMLKKMKDLYGGTDPYKDAIKQIDDTLALVGGFDAATSWMGESGIAIARSGDSITGGIVIVPTDKTAANRLLTQLKGFVSLGGAQAGIKVSDEDYKGTPITVLDLSGLSSMAGAMMTPGVALPADLKVSYAVTDDVVVLGYGTDFVKAVLDARTGDSLAKNARFKEALGRVGASNAGFMWFDIAAIRGIVEGYLPATEKATYEKDVKPYLDPLDYLIEANVSSAQSDGGSFVLHVTDH